MGEEDRVIATKADQETLDRLYELDFPILNMAYVDEDTLTWFEKIELADLGDRPPVA